MRLMPLWATCLQEKQSLTIKQQDKAGKMVQEVMVFAAKPEGLGSIPRTHVLDRQNDLQVL